MDDITVVIPAYKASETIGKTIKSLELQTDNHFTVQIVEDGYDSAQRIALYDIINNTDGMLINDTLLQKNRGVGFARNTGLRYAKTPYVVFLDSDDYLLPNAIANFRELIEKEPDVIIGKTMRESQNGKFQVVGNAQVTWVHGRCYKKSFLESYGITFPELPMSEDLSFNAACVEFAKTVFETAWPVHIQRWHEGSISRSADSDVLQARTYIKSCIEYVKMVSQHIAPVDMKLLPQFVAMSYFYLDAIQYKENAGSEELYEEMCDDFCRLGGLIDLEHLVKTGWGDKLNEQLLIPVRPYSGKPLPPILSFGNRWATALMHRKNCQTTAKEEG